MDEAPGQAPHAAQMGPDGADFAKLPRPDVELEASPLETDLAFSLRSIGIGDAVGAREANRNDCNPSNKSLAALTLPIDHRDSRGTNKSRTVSFVGTSSRTLASYPIAEGAVALPDDDGNDAEAAAAGSNKANDVLMAKINAFNEQRQEEKRRMFAAVLRLLHRLMALGWVGSCLGNVFPLLLPMDYVYDGVIAVSFGLILCGFITATVCPVEVLDVNALCRRNPKISVVASLSAAGVAVLHFPYFPHLELLKVISIVGICVSVWRCRPAWWPENTTFWFLYMFTDQVAWGSNYLFYDRNQALLQLRRHVSLSLAGLHLIMGPVLLVAWRWRRAHLARCTPRSANCSLCIATYEVLYCWCIITCLSTCTLGASWIILPGPEYPDLISGLIMLGRGICIGAPALLVLLTGRGRLFRILGKKFDREPNRCGQDGAFIAELLDTIPVEVGQTWWVHRDNEDKGYAETDPRRMWQQGLVTEVTNAFEFNVRLPKGAVVEVPENGLVASVTSNASLPSLSSAVRWPLRDLFAAKQEEGPVVPVKLPSSGEGRSQADLLRQARLELRCVDAWNLSQEIMRKESSRNNPELQAAWYALSRPVKEGEQIDFFISNSWYDDAEQKWARLTEIIDKFQKRHGRLPTFWLDKLCIVQTAVPDGLKVLPVNVMACRKLLVLCGDTYLSRLWCIWELFTLFAFASEEAAVDRVEFVCLDGSEGIAMLRTMESFNVSNSHCYDPNEEARLRQVIDAVGTAGFNKRIAQMARAMRVRLEQRQRVSPRSPSKGSFSSSLNWVRSPSKGSVSTSVSWIRMWSGASEPPAVDADAPLDCTHL